MSGEKREPIIAPIIDMKTSRTQRVTCGSVRPPRSYHSTKQAAPKMPPSM